MKKSKANRKPGKADLCQTPGYAIQPLLPHLKDPYHNLVIWEPACGEGILTWSFNNLGYRIIGTDIKDGFDYFYYEIPDNYHIQITNPPFSLKYGWLARSYELGKPFALLLQIDVFGSGKAQRLFNRYGIEVILMDKRIDFKMPNKGWTGGGSHFSVAWFTWGLGIGQTLTFATLDKPKRGTINDDNCHVVYWNVNNQKSLMEEQK